MMTSYELKRILYLLIVLFRVTYCYLPMTSIPTIHSVLLHSTTLQPEVYIHSCLYLDNPTIDLQPSHYDDFYHSYIEKDVYLLGLYETYLKQEHPKVHTRPKDYLEESKESPSSLTSSYRNQPFSYDSNSYLIIRLEFTQLCRTLRGIKIPLLPVEPFLISQKDLIDFKQCDKLYFTPSNRKRDLTVDPLPFAIRIHSIPSYMIIKECKDIDTHRFIQDHPSTPYPPSFILTTLQQHMINRRIRT
jgi:hypothetical protein